MLLRRVTEHIKKQNWFAVWIDLIIVVVGVFIGIQVANWNEARTNKAGLQASLERLDKEVLLNIEMIDSVLVLFDEGRPDLDQGRAALNDCAYSPEGQAALERLLFYLVEDVQPNFVSVALDQLASQVRYQDLLSAQFQQDFGLYAGRLKEEHEQLTSHYKQMWSHHINYHPDVSAYFGKDSDGYEDWGFKLDKPFADICTDASFRNRFINSIGFYTSINNRLAEFKVEAEQFRDALEQELDRD
ncbi:MAG: hypothetical protein AAF385_08270 [Pseudomonadota bacterium]